MKLIRENTEKVQNVKNHEALQTKWSKQQFLKIEVI